MDVSKPSSHISTNECVFRLITGEGLLGKRVLDIGAGAGYMVRQLADHIVEQGGEPADILNACDRFPEHFACDAIPCNRLEFLSSLPYDDDTFDLVYTVEVIEHLRNPLDLLAEAYRVLRPGGKLIITTPNVLNVNSRLSYLLRGFFVLFGPLSREETDAVGVYGHIMPLSYYYLDYFMRQEGFSNIELHVDRIKKSAVFYCVILWPFIKLSSLRHKARGLRKNRPVYVANADQIETMNSFRVLLARSCILVGRK
jgi:SAM-dependent methyltransferase